MKVPPVERFTDTAARYAKYRPGYPVALVDRVVELGGAGPGARVVDLGAGTGISSRLFAARGFDVTGVEPNDAMRAHAEAAGGARYVRGEATATGLPDRSQDLAIAGQSFHWFPIPDTVRELRRVLVPGACAAAFWNARARTPFLDAYEGLLRGLSSEYGEVPKARPTIQAIQASPLVRDARTVSLDNRQVLDLEGLVGRAFSSSYVAHGVADAAAFERELTELFHRHAKDGRVAFDYETLVVVFRP